MYDNQWETWQWKGLDVDYENVEIQADLMILALVLDSQSLIVVPCVNFL